MLFKKDQPCKCGHDRTRHFNVVYNNSEIRYYHLTKKNLVCGHNDIRVHPKQNGFQMTCDCLEFKLDTLRYLEVKAMEKCI